MHTLSVQWIICSLFIYDRDETWLINPLPRTVLTGIHHIDWGRRTLLSHQQQLQHRLCHRHHLVKISVLSSQSEGLPSGVLHIWIPRKQRALAVGKRISVSVAYSVPSTLIPQTPIKDDSGGATFVSPSLRLRKQTNLRLPIKNCFDLTSFQWNNNSYQPYHTSTIPIVQTN